MRSPRKKNVELMPQQFSDVEVNICPETGGIWLDEGELIQLSDWFHSGDEFEVEANKHVEALSHDTTDSPCPRCKLSKARLVRYSLPCVEEYQKVSLDICRRCLGIWIDGPELRGVREIMMKKEVAPVV